MTTEIPIRFINATGKTDFHVIVCTRNFSTSTPETLSCAWQVIDVQSSSSFNYPISTSVVAFYTDSSGKENRMGPFPSKLGSTWEIEQEDEQSAPVLNKGTFSLSYGCMYFKFFASCMLQCHAILIDNLLSLFQ